MNHRRFALAALLTVCLPLSVHTADAQLIPIRTVPVASGDQFRLLPSSRMGMGGVRYAVDDTLADPWTNPALGVLTQVSTFMGSPTFYSISDQGGAGRSFPVSGVFVSPRWFGGASVALQQIENPGFGGQFFLAEPWIDICCPPPQTRTLSETFGRNLYASGFLGRRLGDGPWSVGLGISTSALNAMDGVDLLYAGADRIDQDGSIQDFRLGLARTGTRDRLSLIAIHNRVSMQHDVTFTEWRWNDSLMISEFETRLDQNQDQTRTWAGHATWSRALDTPGWRIGASATVNHKSHPKIPNYTLQNIPRDPGTTWAYEVGFGFAMSEAASTFALDVALQPIWSNTWQEANVDDVTASGGRLDVGDRSIENDFFFTNVMIRSGLSHQFDPVQLQVGVEVRSYDYELDQVNRVDLSFRDQSESWVEWTPTFGAVFGFDALDVRYGLRSTTGTGRPGIGGGRDVAFASAEADFILAPDGPLTLRDARVLTHQISVTLPVR
jgi:hypothetical protein